MNKILNSDILKNYEVTTIMVALAVPLVLGMVIYFTYKRFYAGVIYSRSFAVTLVGMSILTCMVTLAISTNVVISLGMVGALSIVRYRTAVKDPFDLLYMFWAITTGITSGAGMFGLGVLACFVMVVMIMVFYHKQEKAQVYICIVHFTGDETADQILREFGKLKTYVKSKTMRKDSIEMAVEVVVKKQNLFFAEKIRNIPEVKDLVLIQYNGEYHG